MYGCVVMCVLSFSILHVYALAVHYARDCSGCTCNYSNLTPAHCNVPKSFKWDLSPTL